MSNITLQELLENGLYFGHPSKQSDPRMKPFIFGKRQGIYIIDLEKTKSYLEKACRYLTESAKEGKSIMLVGTKRQAREMVKGVAEERGILYMANRWLGGTLTNFQTLKKRIDRLNELEAKEASGVFERLTKKEASVARREKGRLMKNLEGVRMMNRIPDVLLVIDARKEEIAVREAKKLGLTVVGVVDTNSNPNPIDYPIPANDDGIKGLRFLLGEFNLALKSGLDERAKVKEVAAAEKEKALKKEIPVEKEKEAKPEGTPEAKPEETAEEKPVVMEDVPVETGAEKEVGAEISEEKKIPAKPKPRPRIRAKVRRTTAKKTPKEKNRKPKGA